MQNWVSPRNQTWPNGRVKLTDIDVETFFND